MRLPQGGVAREGMYRFGLGEDNWGVSLERAGSRRQKGVRGPTCGYFLVIEITEPADAFQPVSDSSSPWVCAAVRIAPAASGVT